MLIELADLLGDLLASLIDKPGMVPWWGDVPAAVELGREALPTLSR
jgi:hypothetical protein